MKPDAVLLVGAVMLLLGGYILWRAHRARGNAIDLAFLLVDGDLNPPRVTLAKFGGLVALLTSTWLVVYLAVAGKLDGVIFGAYLTAWAAVKIAADVTRAREGEK